MTATIAHGPVCSERTPSSVNRERTRLSPGMNTALCLEPPARRTQAAGRTDSEQPDRRASASQFHENAEEEM